jgi:zinc/manganese transport system substrate-binding protein
MCEISLAMKTWLLSLNLLLALPLAAQVKTVALHPLLTDLVKRVGGDQVTVIDLIGKTGDPHHFEPSADQLKKTMGAALYFVSGMGLESYLPSLKSIIDHEAKIIEVGATIPSIEGSCDHCEHEDEEEHEHNHNIDPHWWHSIENFRRAVNVVAAELIVAAPAHKDLFEKNAAAYRSELEELDRWTRKEIAKIPKASRQLATAHDAFGYFCKDYGFTAFPVQGINREQHPNTAELGELIDDLKKHQVAAIFPEKESNPKILSTITKDTGIKLAHSLIADGTTVDTYAEMVKHNVNAIVEALGAK